MCVCVCVCERERKKQRHTQRNVSIFQSVFLLSAQMSVFQVHTTVSNSVLIRLAPTRAPATLAIHWTLMEGLAHLAPHPVVVVEH